MGAVLQSSRRQREALWDEHEAIAAAIAAGDAERAARLIDHHGRRASENLLARLADSPAPLARKAPHEAHPGPTRAVRPRRLPVLPRPVQPPRRRRRSPTPCPRSTPGARPTTCARRARTRCARTSPRTCTASRSRGWRATRAWSSRCRTCSARRSTCTSSRSTARWPSTATSGSGTRTTAPGSTTTRCPTERAMNVAIFLDDVNEFNGPLMFIPGSHKRGVVDAKHDLTTTSYPLWTVDNDLIAQAGRARRRQERRHRLAQGPGRLDDPVPLLPGARLERRNLSPWNRVSVYLSLCAVSQPHPPLQAARSTSPTATSRRSSACPTTAC